MSLIRDLKGEQYVHLAVHLGAKDAPIKSLLCMYLKTVCFVWHTVKPVVPRCSVPKSVPVGKSAELHCVEDDGFPKSRYQWFRNKEEIPLDPKSSPKFFNSSYTLNGEMGTLVSRGDGADAEKEVWRHGERGYFREPVHVRRAQPWRESAALICTFQSAILCHLYSVP